MGNVAGKLTSVDIRRWRGVILGSNSITGETKTMRFSSGMKRDIRDELLLGLGRTGFRVADKGANKRHFSNIIATEGGGRKRLERFRTQSIKARLVVLTLRPEEREMDCRRAENMVQIMETHERVKRLRRSQPRHGALAGIQSPH